ncbi:DUF1002 domain-containing protein [Sporosalibacterium faouarense]|uniref:DUF1002 domain-containing protein n=1 Tax=Sporosalibacterium faouarense TaxID=516123 RepID=UPI00141D2F84|nr:DUF1002 domain-containing protein [Sporosalibacterium faouarense]MTI48361.1 DUF1002 domain-containing protein [Bacillota bacterium]
MYKKTNILLNLILLISLIFASVGFTKGIDSESEKVVISLGEDLNKEQRNQILDIFNVEESTKVIYVTNQEERDYLSGYIKEELIGTRAISSAYVMELEEGKGIDVETYNITWVTKEMYKNALITAGIEDAKVKIAAPIKVSGTAALTGIIKAFEDVTGSKIDEEKKKVANEEISRTGQLGDEIGKDNASELVRRVKEEIISKDVKDESDIKKIIIEITGDLNINLNKEQIDTVTTLMKNISKLDLNINEVKQQLKGVTEKINKVSEENKEVKSMLQRVLDFIRQLFAGIFAWLGDIL